MLSDTVHVGVSVGHELKESIALVARFPAQLEDLLVDFRDPRVLQDLLKLDSL